MRAAQTMKTSAAAGGPRFAEGFVGADLERARLRVPSSMEEEKLGAARGRKGAMVQDRLQCCQGNRDRVLSINRVGFDFD